MYLLYMGRQGAVADWRKISATQGNLASGTLNDTDHFGAALALVEDLEVRFLFPCFMVACRFRYDGHTLGAAFVDWAK